MKTIKDVLKLIDELIKDSTCLDSKGNIDSLKDSISIEDLEELKLKIEENPVLDTFNGGYWKALKDVKKLIDEIDFVNVRTLIQQGWSDGLRELKSKIDGK